MNLRYVHDVHVEVTLRSWRVVGLIDISCHACRVLCAPHAPRCCDASSSDHFVLIVSLFLFCDYVFCVLNVHAKPLNLSLQSMICFRY
jgi:hypothetical protein